MMGPRGIQPPWFSLDGCTLTTGDCVGFVRVSTFESPDAACRFAFAWLTERRMILLGRAIFNAAELATELKLLPQPDPIHDPRAEVERIGDIWYLRVWNCAGVPSEHGYFSREDLARAAGDGWVWTRRFHILFRSIANFAAISIRALEGTGLDLSNPPSME